MDPPPGESQPSGKIRKGFKLFGKRKPGNIFSIRSKGDGNNKSPVNKGKTIDGLSDTGAPDMEPESDKEKRQEVSQGEKEQAEEEPLGEDGVMAAAAARASISSMSSAKSLSFLSLLRGGRRGMGDRRVQTVSQPVGRQRRGLKGLFGTVKFRSKDKEEQEDAPPSPLLMLSRANSVEIIKEDLTLTPKFQPRSLDSPESESSEPLTSVTTPGREVPSPSETINPQLTAGNLNRTDELVPQPPMVPGESSLSSLLADISSLLTFDSISGGGDFMADVEAEWGKASNAISAAEREVTPSSASFFSKPTISSPVTSTLVSTAPTTFQSKAFPAPSPVSPLPSGPAPWQSEAPSSAKMTGSGQVSPDCQLVNPSSTGILGAQTRPSKTEELHSESRTNLQGPSRDKKSPQVKASVLSKIPVVGGGRAGKLPVRESQHFDDEASRDPPTPEYETPHFNSHDAARSIIKHTLEENQQPPQPKVLPSVQRDSKIPVKHGATASQIPVAKEPPRSKIPTSKVPVRRVGNKPAAAGGSTQTRR
ncbi:unnamed protein product [Pleuronectes platessa]|uniref:APC membrane recruitment protein 2 n=1 Tax=Pleuronectes platessa TaxID=8262 RepID=A0A9N7YD28_PLEPL|nr:unnamed protein product [Pleuronectes platessa]